MNALLHDLPESLVSYDEELLGIDLENRSAQTSKGEIRFQHLVSSAPFNRLCNLAKVLHSPSTFSSNKVLVFNLGFDRKGQDEVHWVYFPDKSLPFYRIGFYDNILGDERMSLYVEIGAKSGQKLDVEEMRGAVLEGLEREGYVDGHKLVSWHSVAMDPAYVHITRESIGEHIRIRRDMQECGVHPVGRYGGWTYCSIEDNIIETRALAAELASE